MNLSVVIGLSAVIIAIKDGEAVTLTVRPHDARTSRASAVPGLPFGPFDHEIGGLISGPGPAWPCAAGTQNAYFAGIAFPLLMESTRTLSVAADAAGGAAIAMAKAPSATPA